MIKSYQQGLKKLINSANRLFSSTVHTKFCIVGGGTAGINVAAQLLKQEGVFSHQIRIFEPNSQHHYQPGYTMIGGGLVSPNFVVAKTEKMIPKGIAWTQQAVQKFDPENNIVFVQNGQSYSYDWLIVATGIVNNYESIKGLKEALDDKNAPVATIYNFNYSVKYSELMKNFKNGKAIFTFPQIPIKCAGAPQKILYLSDEYWKNKGVRSNIKIDYNITNDVIFSVKKYSDALEVIAKDKGINFRYKYTLREIQLKDKIAVFEDLNTNQKTEEKFDLLHVVPPMYTPEFIRKSPLVNQAGYVDVDQGTMQSTKYSNIWSLGDCSSLPTSKTAAAVFSQTPYLVKHLMNEVQKKEKSSQTYGGYTSCPIFVGQKKLMLCEFGYGGKVDETFGHQEKPKKQYYLLKRYVFPFAYFNLMPKGLWFGKNTLFNPAK